MSQFSGRVLWFNTVKGLGFIAKTVDGKTTGEEFFVHQSNIRMSGLRTLLPGWEVQFDTAVVGDHDKPQAVRVFAADRPGLMKRRIEKLNLSKATAELLIDSLGRIYVERDGLPTAPAYESSNSVLRAWPATVKPQNGFNFTIPPSTDSTTFLLLDENKNVRRPTHGKYERVRVGSYFLKATVEDGHTHVVIWNLGFRSQEGEYWIIVERRFEHTFETGAQLEPQVPMTGTAARDNDGFIHAIHEAIARNAKPGVVSALREMIQG